MEYRDYLNNIFPGIKVQKISVNAGFTCPNRDGTIGRGGCIYCRNDSFSPSYCMSGDPIAVQIENGKRFFSRKYPDMKYLAYFQSFTNTYGKSKNQQIALYKEALDCEDVVGIIIGTRPDTIDDSLLPMLSEINLKNPVFIEIGAETSNDSTLKLINRGHKWVDVVEAVAKVDRAGLHCGLHLIAGLPGEDEEQILRNVALACELPIESLKLHHLQILKDTILNEKWKNGQIEIHPFNLDEYVDLCVKIVSLIPEHIVIERFLAQSPPDMVIAPKWGLKNYQFMNLLRNKLKESASELN